MKKERMEAVAELLDKRGKLSLTQLCEAFPDVSEMTLRRDLLKLEQENRLIRVRGGAMSVNEVKKVSGEEYTKKTVINTDQKRTIARKAAALIEPAAPADGRARRKGISGKQQFPYRHDLRFGLHPRARLFLQLAD